MLIAIGIYTVERDPETNEMHFTKLQHAQQSKGLFSKYDLETLEKETFPQVISALDSKAVIYCNAQDEHHYVDLSRSTDSIYVMSSRKKLENSEIFYLFSNIQHAHIRPQLKIELFHMIANPFGFSGRDCLIDTVHQQNAAVRKSMMVVIEKMLNRGASIENLVTKTIQLEQDAEIMRFKAKELNKCCRYM